jgi:hypothetical protein
MSYVTLSGLMNTDKRAKSQILERVLQHKSNMASSMLSDRQYAVTNTAADCGQLLSFYYTYAHYVVVRRRTQQRAHVLYEPDGRVL